MLGRRSPLIAFVAFTVAACSSLPDLRFDDPDAATGDGGTDGTAGDGGGSCNCTAVADGWTPVLFSTLSPSSCPTGTTTTELRQVAGDGTPTCSCSCSGVGGSCSSGNFTLAVTNEATCAVGASTASVASDVGACSALSASLTVPAGAFAKVSHVAPASCAATAAPTSKVSDGRICQSSPSSGTCGAGLVCAPSSARNFQSCVTKLGANDCPAAFPKKTTAGITADDSKTCLGCACGAPTACIGGSVSIYDGSMCKTVGSSQGAVGIGTGCAATSDSSFTATHFKSTPASGGCSSVPITQPTPGKVTFTEQRTVCCQ